jgi:hypothetical protein
VTNLDMKLIKLMWSILQLDVITCLSLA